MAAMQSMPHQIVYRCVTRTNVRFFHLTPNPARIRNKRYICA